MIEFAMSPAMFVMFLLAVVATGLTVGLLIEQLSRRIWKWLPGFVMSILDHTAHPKIGDRLVGVLIMLIVVCSVIFLISDFANDWPGAA